MEQIIADFCFGFRSMAKYPIACAVAVISLAGGIGITTAALTIRDTLFLRPPPLYQNPEQLSKISIVTPAKPEPASAPVALYKVWSQQSQLFAGIAGAAPAQSKEVRVADRRETISVRSVTPSLVDLVGSKPILGRTFVAADLEDTVANPVVLNYRAWQILFDSRTDVIGSVVRIENEVRTIVGVMPQGFWVPGPGSVSTPTIWTPLNINAAKSGDVVDVIVRRNHVEPEQLMERLQNSIAAYTAALPDTERQIRVRVTPVRGTPIADAVSPFVVILLGACVVLTLLIACSNVAVLVIAQWTAREHEIVIRTALGAGRSRIVRLLLAESVLMAAIGGILGIGATIAIRGLILRNTPAGEAVFFTIDPIIFAQSFAITLLCGLAAGIGPALIETRSLQKNPVQMMRKDRARQRWRQALVVVEITVTVALLVVTAAMVSAARDYVSGDYGFSLDRLLAVRVENPNGVRIREITERLKSLPGVVGAAPASAVPILGRPASTTVSLAAAASASVEAETTRIDPDFFTTLGVALRRGRSFTNQDTTNAARAAIINQKLAEALLPGRDPIGTSVRTGGAAYEIVGVVSDYSNAPLGRRRPGLFLPLTVPSPNTSRIELLVRADRNPAELVRAIRAEIQALAPDHAVPSAFVIQSILETGGQEVMVSAALMAPMIAIGLFLSAAGIYGVLAFAVARRSKELALRIAIGATRTQLFRAVAGQAIQLLSVGAVSGAGATFAVSKLAQTQGGFFESPRWPMFIIPVVIVFAVGALASWIPSRRALSVDPAVLLRSE
jgi:putative ABC transport system permease protein